LQPEVAQWGEEEGDDPQAWIWIVIRIILTIIFIHVS